MAGYSGFEETDASDSTGEPADAEQLAVGTVSEDGQWQWNGTEWTAATPAGENATAESASAAAEAGEPQEWDREINDSIDDPTTEAAEPPSVEATGASV